MNNHSNECMKSEIDTTFLLGFYVPKLVDMYILIEEKVFVYLFCLQFKFKKVKPPPPKKNKNNNNNKQTNNNIATCFNHK